MALVEAVRSRVRRALVARSPGIDLSRLDRVPERLTWPLRREGMEPFHRVEELRETQGPVARVVTFLGVEVWLVTGDAEAREVLADPTSYSTDIRPYMGKSGRHRRHRRPGVHRPARPHPAARAAHARVHDAAARAAASRHRPHRRGQLDEIDGSAPTAGDGRPGPDLRVPGAVPGHLRAARAARRGARDVPHPGHARASTSTGAGRAPSGRSAGSREFLLARRPRGSAGTRAPA